MLRAHGATRSAARQGQPGNPRASTSIKRSPTGTVFMHSIRLVGSVLRCNNVNLRSPAEAWSIRRRVVSSIQTSSTYCVSENRRRTKKKKKKTSTHVLGTSVDVSTLDHQRVDMHACRRRVNARLHLSPSFPARDGGYDDSGCDSPLLPSSYDY